MADISKITLPNGVTYDIKDATARNQSKDIFYAYAHNTTREATDTFIIDLPIDDLVSDGTIVLTELSNDTIGTAQITFNVNLNNNKSYQNVPLYAHNYSDVFRGVFPMGTKFLMTAWKNANDNWFFFCGGGPIVTNRQTVETVLGTQTGSTTSWTGKMEDIALLEPGLKILYVLPYDCSGDITIQLAFMDDYSTNVHKTAIIPVYTDKETKLSGDFKAGQTFTLTYYPANSLTLGGNVIAEERFYCASGSTSSGGGEVVVDKNKQLVEYLATMKDGKKYGVYFDDYTVNVASAGTRLYDAVGATCQCSTDAIKGTNTFENVGPFAFVEANGYVDAFGDFQVTAISGLDQDFSRTDADTFCCFVPHYVKVTIDSQGEEIVISDAPFEGCRPESAAIKLDGTIRDFVPIPKYAMGRVRNPSGDGELFMSRSGLSTWGTAGYAAGQMLLREKYGNQVCNITSMDLDHLRTLFQVAFASCSEATYLESHSPGDHSTVVWPATVTETNVERIIISNSTAKNLLRVGQTVHIGNPTTINENQQYNSAYHYYDKAYQVKITEIEDYDSSNIAVYVDNGGVKFDTTDETINGTAYKTQLILLPPMTGMCDDVKGVCGSKHPKTGSYIQPHILFGVELGLGGWLNISNTLVKSETAAGPANIYVIYDCVNIIPNIREPSFTNYTMVGYTKPILTNWTNTNKFGYDPENPSVRLGIAEGSKYSGTGKTPNSFATSNAYVLALYGGGTLRSLGAIFASYVTSVDRYTSNVSYEGAWASNYYSHASAIGRSARVATGYENA